MTGITPNIVSTVATAGTSTAPFITVFFDRPPTANDIAAWKVTQRWVDISVDPVEEYILQGFIAANGLISANWEQLGHTDDQVDTLTGDTGGPVPVDANNNINVLGTAGQVTVTGTPVNNTLTIALANTGTPVHSFAPDTGTNPVVPTAGGLVSVRGQNPANVSGIRVTGSLNELDIAMFSPFVGDFNFLSNTSGDTETLTISNSSNTAGSQAQTLVSVAGTSAGDPWMQWSIGSTVSYAMGPDNSDTQNFNLTINPSGTVNPSTGSDIFSYDRINDYFLFSTALVSNEKSLVGAVVQVAVENLDTTNTSSSARMTITTAATGGDAYIIFDTVAGAQGTFAVGVDNTDNSFNINVNPDTSQPLLTGTPLMTIAAAGNALFSGAALTVETSLVGDVVQLEVVNDDDTNPASAARLNILTEATGGDAYMLIGRDTAGAFEVGIQNTSDSLLFNAGPNASVPNLSGTTVMAISQVGNITLGANNTNVLGINNASVTTVGGAGGASALPATPSGYLSVLINGNPYQIPFYNP